MPLLGFSLIPFPMRGRPPGLTITGSIGRHASALSVDYELRGCLSGLSIPRRAPAPGRRNRLWEETCLELFLGGGGSGSYWEFNLSPAGHWNVYRFDSYREGMREEPAFASLPFAVQRDAATLRLSLNVDVGTILPAGSAADFAACAVVKTNGGDVSHWALTHAGPRPDFHRRDAFKPLP